MTSLFEKFNDGGPFFTYPILILLIVVLVLFVRGILQKSNNQKTTTLIAHIGWFAVAWGFLGRTFGLIEAFDLIAASGDITPSLLADGLKMAILNPLFGIVVFLVARIGLIILTLMDKEKSA